MKTKTTDISTIKYLLAGFLLFIWLLVLFYNIINIKEITAFSTVILGAVVALLVIPWEKLTNLKAGGFELSIQKGFESAVDGYIDSNSEHLLEALEVNKENLPIINKSRILWLEDRPANILGERRILRALGIDIVMGVPNFIDPSSINKQIESDTDFDLIISDIQWKDESNNATYGGLNYVVGLRDSSQDINLKHLPVIFYTAYTDDQLSIIKQQTELKFYEDMYFSSSIEDLVERVIKVLIDYRSRPIKVGRKGAT